MIKQIIIQYYDIDFGETVNLFGELLFKKFINHLSSVTKEDIKFLFNKLAPSLNLLSLKNLSDLPDEDKFNYLQKYFQLRDEDITFTEEDYFDNKSGAPVVITIHLSKGVSYYINSYNEIIYL